MKSATHKISRGRPISSAVGAREAFDLVEEFKVAEGLKNNGLAIRFGMTPSTVNRALKSRENASWTPSFQKLYRNVKSATKEKDVVARLAEYSGPGDSLVRRLLEDVEALVVTLAKRKP